MRLALLCLLGSATLGLGCDDPQFSGGESPLNIEEVDDDFFEDGDCDNDLVGSWSVVEFWPGEEMFSSSDEPACQDVEVSFEDMEIVGTLTFNQDGTWNSSMTSMKGTVKVTTPSACLEATAEGDLGAETICSAMNDELEAMCAFSNDACVCRSPIEADDLPSTNSGTYTLDGNRLTMEYDPDETDPDVVNDAEYYDVCVKGDQAVMRDEEGFVFRLEG